MVLLALTTAIAGTFFGAALYVSLVEHPARVSCGTETAVQEFRPSYRRGAVMQGSLSAIGSLLGLAAAWQLHDVHVGINAILLGLPVPVTILFIAPTTRQLLDPTLDATGPRAASLLARWSRLHWIRTTLGGVAFALFVFRLVIHSST
jgi:Domain of unknown function (DUF1772)